jgi:hypothetical protein
MRSLTIIKIVFDQIDWIVLRVVRGFEEGVYLFYKLLRGEYCVLCEIVEFGRSSLLVSNLKTLKL